MTTPEPPDPVPAPADPPPAPFTCERRDASTVEQWDVPSRTYRRFEGGGLTAERPFTAAENAWADRLTVEETRTTNRAELITRARAAVASNATYLAKVQAGTATNADHIAQVPVLTRQMQGVIRLVVGSDLLDQS